VAYIIKTNFIKIFVANIEEQQLPFVSLLCRKFKNYPKPLS